MFPMLLLTALAATQADTTKSIKFTGDAGLVNLSGNTSLTTINVGDKIETHQAGWSFVQLFSVVYGRNDSVTTTSLWQGSLRAEREISAHVGLFVLGSYDRNVFGGVRARYSPQVGVSAKLINTDSDKLGAEIGGGYTMLRATDVTGDRDFASGRAALNFAHKLGSNATFTQALEYLPDFEVTKAARFNSETALTAPISASISMKASYAIRYNGEPGPTFKKTDRVLTTGLQVSF